MTMKAMGKIMILLLLLFLVNNFGCGTKAEAEPEEEAFADFPPEYISEEYPLEEDYVYITDAAVEEGTLYFCAGKATGDNREADLNLAEIREELYSVNLLADSPATDLIPYQIAGDNHIRQIFPNHDGTLSIVVQNYNQASETAAVNDTWIKKITVAGEELLSYSIREDIEGQTGIIYTDFVTDIDGNAYLIIADSLYIWDPAGQLKYSLMCPGTFPQISQGGDGKVYLTCMNGEITFTISQVDAAAGKLAPLPALAPGLRCYDMAAGMNSVLLIAGTNGISEYDAEEGIVKEIISFPQLDIVASSGGMLLPLSHDRISWLDSEYREKEMRYTLSIIQGTDGDLPGGLQGELPGGAASDKKILTLGGASHDIQPWHYEAVADFNKSAADFRVEIKTYASDDRLNTEIAAGQGPDIIILTHHYLTEQYAAQGVLTDLNPFIDSEADLENDLQENVLKAYEIDGKLYGIPIVYTISTMCVPTSAMGEVNQWTLDEMISFAERYMPDSTVFSEASKSHVLNIILRANSDALIKWEGDRPGFQSDLLAKMLAFANRFIPDQEYPDDENLMERIHEDNQVQIMVCRPFMNFLNVQIEREIFREEISFPGYPTENGSGNLINSFFVAGINSACEEPDIAWQFINSLLAEEYQWSLVKAANFPIRKSVLAKKIEAETAKDYVTDENGEQKERMKGSLPVGDANISAYAATEEDVQTVLDIINHADKVDSSDWQISNIIFEEAGALFSESRTVEEVVEIVENRVGLYLGEMG